MRSTTDPETKKRVVEGAVNAGGQQDKEEECPICKRPVRNTPVHIEREHDWDDAVNPPDPEAVGPGAEFWHGASNNTLRRALTDATVGDVDRIPESSTPSRRLAKETLLEIVELQEWDEPVANAPACMVSSRDVRNVVRENVETKETSTRQDQMLTRETLKELYLDLVWEDPDE